MSDFQLRQQDNISYLVCERLEQECFIAAFSTRTGGVSSLPTEALNLGFFSGDAEENVRENRRRFLAAIGASDRRLVTMHQVHGGETVAVSSQSAGRASANSAGKMPALPGTPKCDGIITADPALLLGVQAADCLPILIADPDTRVVVAVHAGWKGTAARVVERTLARMRLEFGVETDGCFVAMGPSARVCCYEIGPDVVQIFKKSFGYAKQLLIEQPNGRVHLDIPAANCQQLLYAGVAENNVFVSEYCTMCRPDLFFSYRREKESGRVGRLLGVIGEGVPSRTHQQPR